MGAPGGLQDPPPVSHGCSWGGTGPSPPTGVPWVLLGGYRTRRCPMGAPGGLQDPPVSHGCSWGVTGPASVPWVLLGGYRTLPRCPMGAPGGLQDPPVSHGCSWGDTGPTGVPWVLLGGYRTLPRRPMGAPGGLQDPPVSHGCSWGATGPSPAVPWVLVGGYRTLPRRPMGAPGGIQDPPASHGCSWGATGPAGVPWVLLGGYKTPWHPVGAPGGLQDPPVSHGWFWGVTGPSGVPWVLLGGYRTPHLPWVLLGGIQDSPSPVGAPGGGTGPPWCSPHPGAASPGRVLSPLSGGVSPRHDGARGRRGRGDGTPFPPQFPRGRGLEPLFFSIAPTPWLGPSTFSTGKSPFKHLPPRWGSHLASSPHPKDRGCSKGASDFFSAGAGGHAAVTGARDEWSRSARRPGAGGTKTSPPGLGSGVGAAGGWGGSRLAPNYFFLVGEGCSGRPRVEDAGGTHGCSGHPRGEVALG